MASDQTVPFSNVVPATTLGWTEAQQGHLAEPLSPALTVLQYKTSVDHCYRHCRWAWAAAGGRA